MTDQSNDQLRFLRNLRSVREYTSGPIPDEVLKEILEVGRWSGSASNRQVTEVVVVRDRDLLGRMSELGARPAAGAAAALVVVVPDDERRELHVFDNGRLVERLLLAAKALGVGGNIATLKEDGPAVVGELLGVPDDKRVWTVVTLGYVDAEARRARAKNPNAGRKSMGEFARWDRY